MLAALAAIDFYNEQPTQKSLTGRQTYFYAARNAAEKVEWNDLPVARNDQIIPQQYRNFQKQMIYFTTLVYAWKNFYKLLLDDKELASKPFLVPWYYKRFISIDADKLSLTSDTAREKIENVSKFFECFMQWLHEIHQSGTGQVALNLFNIDKLKSTSTRETNLGALALGLGVHGKKLKYNDFWNIVLDVEPPDFEEPMPLLMNILTEASQEFCDQCYNFIS